MSPPPAPIATGLVSPTLPITLTVAASSQIRLSPWSAGTRQIHLFPSQNQMQEGPLTPLPDAVRYCPINWMHRCLWELESTELSQEGAGAALSRARKGRGLSGTPLGAPAIQAKCPGLATPSTANSFFTGVLMADCRSASC